MDCPLDDIQVRPCDTPLQSGRFAPKLRCACDDLPCLGRYFTISDEREPVVIPRHTAAQQNPESGSVPPPPVTTSHTKIRHLLNIPKNMTASSEACFCHHLRNFQ
jgi:hypothetical protein